MFFHLNKFLVLLCLLAFISGCSKENKQEEQKQTQQIQDLKKKLQETETNLQKMKSQLLDAELTSEIERQTADAIYKELMEVLKTEIESGEIQVKRLYKALIIRVADTIFFRSGEYALKPEGKKVLNKIGTILKKITQGKIIQIEGHTDNEPIGQNLIRRIPTNWELGAFRAIEVLHYLEKKTKIMPENLSAVTFSSYRPLENNSTFAGKAKNRRIEIIVIDERIYRHDLEEAGDKAKNK